MNQIIANFNKLLEKYKFTNDIPANIQNYAISTSKINLISILKLSGDYTFIFGRILSIYIASRRIKIRLTFTQSKIILSLFAITVAVIVSFGGYLIVNSLSEIISDKKQIDKVSESADRKNVINIDKSNNDSLNSMRFIVGVNEFTGDPDAQRTTQMITTGLKNAIGKDKVTLLDDKKRNKVGKIVMGSIRNIGRDRFINVKIIDTETSKVDYATSEKIGSEDELDEACERIAKRIASQIE